MIPQAYITEWSNNVPWQSNEQIEQDLVICRALVEIFSDPYLSESLAFRGGTALHKLYLQPQPRYSEDIDLVQITSEPFGNIIDRLRSTLSFLGEPRVKQKAHNNTLIFKFDSEFAPVQSLRLKVETNTKEHFSVLGIQKYPFAVASSWYAGNCFITTYKIEELLGTKLRALYQRKKGRDLYDMYIALMQLKDLNLDEIITCHKKYMNFSAGTSPTQKQYLLNMAEKMTDSEFLGDIKALIRPGAKYDSSLAYELVLTSLIEKINP